MGEWRERVIDQGDNGTKGRDGPVMGGLGDYRFAGAETEQHGGSERGVQGDWCLDMTHVHQ